MHWTKIVIYFFSNLLLKRCRAQCRIIVISPLRHFKVLFCILVKVSDQEIGLYYSSKNIVQHTVAESF